MEYQISVSEKQARIISSALDVYSRIQGGQFARVLDRFEWKDISDDEKDKIDTMLTDIKCMLTGVEGNGYMGIGQINDDGRIAYDMHEVIRHRLAHIIKPKPSSWAESTVDFKSPSQYGSEILCKIKKIEEMQYE